MNIVPELERRGKLHETPPRHASTTRWSNDDDEFI